LSSPMSEPNREPVVEIEITPEMIEAGSRVLREHWLALTEPDPELFPLVARKMFCAMHQSR
jgi:hypothetical protein